MCHVSGNLDCYETGSEATHLKFTSPQTRVDWLDQVGSAGAQGSRETEILKRGASNSAIDVRIDDQFDFRNA